MTKYTNILGTITAILTFLLGVMTQVFGCTPVEGAITATCTSTLLPAKYMVWLAMLFGVLTLASKAVRPGGLIHSMFGKTAVIVPESKAGVGTVTPAQVAEK